MWAALADPLPGDAQGIMPLDTTDLAALVVGEPAGWEADPLQLQPAISDQFAGVAVGVDNMQAGTQAAVRVLERPQSPVAALPEPLRLKPQILRPRFEIGPALRNVFTRQQGARAGDAHTSHLNVTQNAL